jgi:hypothetical protein
MYSERLSRGFCLEKNPRIKVKTHKINIKLLTLRVKKTPLILDKKQLG